VDDLIYIYTNNKFLQKQHGANPTAWHKKNMLFEDSMFDVDESANENDSLDKDPTTSNESNENDVEHDPFEFSLDDEIPFSRLLSNLTIGQAQGSNNDNVSPNMPLLDDNFQVSNVAPLGCTCSNNPKSKHIHAINEFHGGGTPN
jgi:hypothetical protein